jgi:hypothetical protein
MKAAIEDGIEAVEGSHRSDADEVEECAFHAQVGGRRVQALEDSICGGVSAVLCRANRSRFSVARNGIAGTATNGRYTPQSLSRIMQHHIKPAASEAGIEIKGWHTLRHSYTTLLWQNNGDLKVVQGLLRHNSIKVTMDIYDEAMSDEKQMAHRKVLRLVTRKEDRAVMRTASGTGVPAST